MADRFPLILNTSANQIQEITSGDQLDLSGNNVANAGIITASSFSGPVVAGAGVSNITAGIGTYTDLRVGGDTTFSEDFVVTGNARVTGILTVGTSSIILNDSANTIKVGTALTLGHTQGLQFHTQNLHSAGFDVNQINVSGASTIGGNLDANGDLDVDGHTNLDNINIAGVTTTTGVVVINAGTESTSTTTGALRVAGGVGIVKNLYVGGILDSDGPTHLDYVSISGVTTHSDTVHIIDDKVLMFGSGGDSTIEYDENGTDQLTIAGAATRFTNTTQSTSKDTGSVIFEGGLGVEKNLSVGGNLSVSGVLTYEDVTNVDSIGIVTARNGLRVTGGTSNFTGDATFNGGAGAVTIAAGSDIRIAGGGWTGEYTGGIKIQPDASNSYLQYHGTLYFRNVGGANRFNIDQGGNATFTGSVTANGGFGGSGASLTNLNGSNIASGTVPVARIGTGTKNTSTFYRGDGTFQVVSTDLVNDTSPQLGGDLSSNNFDIHISDNKNLEFGDTTNPDLYIKHSSGHNANFIVSYNGDIEHHMASSKKIIKGFNNSGTPYVSLYSDGVEKLKTDNSQGVIFNHNHSGNEPLCQAAAKGGFHSGFVADPNAGYQGHFRYARAGTMIAQLRNPADTTQLGMYFFSTGKEHHFFANGDVDWNGNLKPAANNTYDLGTTSLRWRNIYTNDLNLSNEGGKNEVDGTWGNYTIQEGESDLFLINKRSGKKYKFNLTEVS